MSKTEAVDHLIKFLEDDSLGGTLQQVAIEALGEAGGNHAIDFLIKYSDQLKNGTSTHLAVLKALGRASRNVE